MQIRNLRFVIIALTVFLFAALSSGAQVVKTIHSFTGTDGECPDVVVLAQGSDGRLYGTTSSGGASGLGTIFKQGVSKLGTVVIHNLVDAEGSFPGGGLTLGSDGNFYGSAPGGGTLGFGTIYKMNPAGAVTVLYNFTNGVDGELPLAPPILASDGNYYGATVGSVEAGSTFYSVTPSGVFSVIYTSSFDKTGSTIQSPLLQGVDGSLYATASIGGEFGCGAIVNITTSGALKGHYSFHCHAGGLTPIGTLLQDPNSNLYGTTLNGGTHANAGTIFKIDASLQSWTKLYDFGSFQGDGYGGLPGLTLGTDGNLYGGTSIGGKHGAGSLYKITTDGTYTQLYSFPKTNSPTGQYLTAAVVQDTNGVFYGVTAFGGKNGLGSIYSLDVGLGPFVKFVLPTGKAGQKAQILGQGFTGATSVTFNGVPATTFNVARDTYMTAVVPDGATTGPVVVTTPTGKLTSNVNFRISQ